MRTDTKAFKAKLRKALRSSRGKWATDEGSLSCNRTMSACGFCDAFSDWLDDNSCGACAMLFWEKIGIRKPTTDKPICVLFVGDFHAYGNEERWRKACTTMNKRFDKIAKLYGVDA